MVFKIVRVTAQIQHQDLVLKRGIPNSTIFLLLNKIGASYMYVQGL